MNRLLTAILIVTLAWPAQAASQHTHMSQYAGQETRDIKSLSAEDLAELKRGGGWGLAKAAELNGYPGPAHVLEMKEEIGLSDDQIKAISAIFDIMQKDAIVRGERFVALERRLEEGFQARSIDEDRLRRDLQAIAEARSALRETHLAAHLKTVRILSEEQIAAYNTLRGYGAQDPCAAVPEGHDPAMWRKHNGCD